MSKTHRIADRVAEAGQDARKHVGHARMEKLDRENERLRAEVSLLGEDVDRGQSALEAALKGLDKVHVDHKRRGPRFGRAFVIAATGYVLGTRDGHERYAQIRNKGRTLSETSYAA